jgi:hypothetical protein
MRNVPTIHQSLLKWYTLLSEITSEEREALATRAYAANKWFDLPQVLFAWNSILRLLEPENLQEWLNHYPLDKESQVKVGIVMAGNIPAAGFHDLLCVLATGNTALVKLSKDDTVMMTYLIEHFQQHFPEEATRIQIVHYLKEAEALLASGTDQAAKHFHYYFKSIPHIIRANRSSVAVLVGDETEDEIKALGEDIFRYYGLGCRNVSKLYLHAGFAPERIYPSLEVFSHVREQNRYMNNYDYTKAIYLLNGESFLDNGFLMLKEGEAVSTPVGVLHYAFYESPQELAFALERDRETIQCVVGKGYIPFGQAQLPGPDDYPDGVDTMAFLTQRTI